MKPKHFALGLLCSLCLFTGYGQEVSALADAFIETLSPELRAETIMSLDSEDRVHFHFVPKKRKGVTFKNLDTDQTDAAIALLKVSLSEQGYKKTKEITELENILIVLENNKMRMPDGSPMRDALNYHFLIFRNKKDDTFWGWRFEGHHISLNFVAKENEILSSTPAFLGSNPAKVPSGPHQGKEVLKQESDFGFSLVNSLSEKQQRSAIVATEAPKDILSGTRTSVDPIEPLGISYKDLSSAQKRALITLIEVYLGNYTKDFQTRFWKKIKSAGLEKLSFAWAGSLSPGKGHYYRIQNPVLLIEFDNTQNNANHIHTVVRDLTNDFGEDVLKSHYKESHTH